MTTPVRQIEREAEDGERRNAPLWHRALAFLIKGGVAVAILGVLGWVAWDVYTSAPGATRADRPRVARLVDVITVEAADQGPRIEAWGEVVAERTLSLRPEIGGRVSWLNPALTAGGHVEAGETLFRLDDAGLSLDLARAEAAMRQIEARIRVERGQGARAERDLERAPLKLTEEQRSLVLREPQMAELSAELAAAEAARDAAAVELEKTTVTAPFDALVISETIAPGATVAANSPVAELVASDAYRVELAVPLSALAWVDAAGNGTVRLTQPDAWPDGAYREAVVERLAPDLTETGRMAGLIVRVDDPLALEADNAGKPALLIGSFLAAEIEGRAVENAVVLPRAYLRDAHTVWVMTPENTLDIRAVEIAWRGAREVLISSGLSAGEQVVTTHLATVADGMKLRTGEQSEAPAKDAVAEAPADQDG